MDGFRNLYRAFFDWEIIVGILPDLLTTGLVNTLILTVASYTLALGLGTLLALARLSRRWYLSMPVKIYVDAWRALPAIVKVLIVGLGLPLAGIAPFGRNAYPYAIIAIAMIASAYICEVLRSGIQSVERGQMDAARSLGLSYLRSMWLLIIPQGVRRVLPALMNQFIIVVKETSLVFLLGLTVSQREIFSIAQQGTAETGSLAPMVAAGLCYLLIVIPLIRLVDWLDHRMREGRPGPTADDETDELVAAPQPGLSVG